MPTPIRKSDRAAGKLIKSNDIPLDDNLTFLFYFHVDNSYMLFKANEKAWPKTILKKLVCKDMPKSIFQKLEKVSSRQKAKKL